jgi:hypothetical protein
MYITYIWVGVVTQGKVVAYTAASIVVWCGGILFSSYGISAAVSSAGLRRMAPWLAAPRSSSQLASCSEVQLLPSSSMCCPTAVTGAYIAFDPTALPILGTLAGWSIPSVCVSSSSSCQNCEPAFAQDRAEIVIDFMLCL